MSGIAQLGLELLAAFITKHGITKIFIAAGGTRFRLGHLFHCAAAAGTKFGTGSQVFVTFAALDKNKLLMAALGTEFGVNPYGMLAIRTVNSWLFLFLRGLGQCSRKILGKHGRHH